jgi:thioredoxin reductase
MHLYHLQGVLTFYAHSDICSVNSSPAAGIAQSVLTTRYGLDDPVIESEPVQTGPEAHQASYTMDTGSFPGVKRPRYSVDHPIPI